MRNDHFIPFEIESDVGEIRESEKLCPGMYYVSAHDPATGLPHEYYNESRYIHIQDVNLRC